jgi:hypothetical protein
MRYALHCCWIGVIVACAKPEAPPAKEPAADATPAAAPAAPAPAAPAAISLNDVAGKWSMHTMAEQGDSVLVKYELVATADPAGWRLNFPNRKPITPKVEASGDSIIVDAGPYESVLRKGTQVTTHGVMRLVDGKLMGSTVAHYNTKGADSVRNLRTEGTKQ